MKKITGFFCAVIMVFVAAGTVVAENYGGIEFPDGEVSFADNVVSYKPGDGGIESGYNDPYKALGPPEMTTFPILPAMRD